MKSFLARMGGRLKTRRLPRAPCDCGDFVEAIPDTPTFAQLSPYLYARYDQTVKATASTNTTTTNTSTSSKTNNEQEEKREGGDEAAAREAYVRAVWFDLHYRCGAQGRCVLCSAYNNNNNSTTDEGSKSEEAATMPTCRFPRCIAMRPASKGAEVRAVRAAYEDSAAAELLIASNHSATLTGLIRRARSAAATAKDLAAVEKGIKAYAHSLIRQAARGRPLQSRLRGGHNDEESYRMNVYDGMASRLTRSAGEEAAQGEVLEGDEYDGDAGDGGFSPAEPKYGPQSSINGVNPLAEEEEERRGKTPTTQQGKNTKEVVGTAGAGAEGVRRGAAAVLVGVTHRPASPSQDANMNEKKGEDGNDDEDDGRVAASPTLLREKVKALYLWRAALLVNLRRDEDAVHSLLNLCDLLPWAHRLPLYTAATNWATLNDMEIIYYRALLQQYASFPRAEEFARHRPLLLPRVLEAITQLPDDDDGESNTESSTSNNNSSNSSSSGDRHSLSRERTARHCAGLVLGKEIQTLLARAQATQFSHDASEDPTLSLCLPLTLHYYRFRLGEAFWRAFFDYLCLPPMPAPPDAAEDASTSTNNTNSDAGVSASDDGGSDDPTPTYILDAIGRSMLLRHLLLFAGTRAREIERGVVAKRVRRRQKSAQAAQYDADADAAQAALSENAAGPQPSDYDFVLTLGEMQVAQTRMRQLLVLVKTFEEKAQRQVTGTAATDTLPRKEGADEVAKT